MSYELFCSKVKFLVAKSGISEVPKFSRDDGKFIAKCDGITIVGKSGSKSVKVSWGYGQHMAVSHLA